jgi:hypothetical protein
MGSGGKKRTTQAKLNRENRLRERKMDKQARKDARKRAAADTAAGGGLEPSVAHDDGTGDGPLAEAPSSAH